MAFSRDAAPRFGSLSFGAGGLTAYAQASAAKAAATKAAADAAAAQKAAAAAAAAKPNALAVAFAPAPVSAQIPTTVAAPVTPSALALYAQRLSNGGMTDAEVAAARAAGLARTFDANTPYTDANGVNHNTKAITVKLIPYAGVSPVTQKKLPDVTQFPAPPGGYPYPNDPTIPLDSNLPPPKGNTRYGGLSEGMWRWLSWRKKLIWNTGNEPGEGEMAAEGMMSPAEQQYFSEDRAHADKDLRAITDVAGFVVVGSVAAITVVGAATAIAAAGTAAVASSAGAGATATGVGTTAVGATTVPSLATMAGSGTMVGAAGSTGAIASVGGGVVATATTAVTTVAPSLATLAGSGSMVGAASPLVSALPAAAIPTATAVGGGGLLATVGGSLATAGAGLAAKVITAKLTASTSVPTTGTAVIGPPVSTTAFNPATTPSLLASLGLGNVDPNLLLIGGAILAAALLL